MNPIIEKFSARYEEEKKHGAAPLHVAPHDLALLARDVEQAIVPAIQAVQKDMHEAFTAVVRPLLGGCCPRVDAKLKGKPGGGVAHDAFITKTVEELIAHNSVGLRAAELETRTPFMHPALLIAHCGTIIEWTQAAGRLQSDWAALKSKLPSLAKAKS